MHLPSVCYFLGCCRCRRGLDELPEASARIGESPGGDFNGKSVKSLEGEFLLARRERHE
jgi:hypothetical protein